MKNLNNQSFSKKERISSQLAIDSLFGGEKPSLSAFPLRMVYSVSNEPSDLPASVLVSVPKKRFHHAVDRNYMKRLVREAYRRHKASLWQKLQDDGKKIDMAFICVTDKRCTYEQVEKSVERLLNKLMEKI